MLGANFGKQVLQVFEQLLIVVEVAAGVERPTAEPIQQFAVGICRGEFFEIFVHVGSEFVGRHFLTADADDRKILGKKLCTGQIVKSGEEFALCEITRRTEDNHDAWLGSFLCVWH